jgi:hypothetical protein
LQFQLLDGTRRQFGEESFEALECVQGSQDADEGNELGAAASFDTLEGALANSRALCELSLGQASLDALALDPLTEDTGNRGVR